MELPIRSSTARDHNDGVLQAAVDPLDSTSRARELDRDSFPEFTDFGSTNRHSVGALQRTVNRKPWYKTYVFWVVVLGGAFAAIILGGVILGERARTQETERDVRVHRVAFSSCTQRYAGENQIWTQAIVPSKPDVWVWLGDLAYMDMPGIDCSAAANAGDPECECPVTFMTHPPGNCYTGDVQNAERKVDEIIRSDGYGQFLEFMCPGYTSSGDFPPDGQDLEVCPRSIYGVYDDHDFGWNNGNGHQLTDKDDIKQVYLDALGVAENSHRRNGLRGIFDHVVLNAGERDREVDLILLDERYERDPLPCHTRQEWCEDETVSKSDFDEAWCDDFLGSGMDNVTDPGSCCPKDDHIALGWCQVEANKADADYSAVCVPSDPLYGATNWVVDEGALRPAGASDRAAADFESGFCEVLGKKQRQWLNATIEAARAPVALVASGSVLFGQPQKSNEEAPHNAYCSGDDWDCYRPAQQNLIAQLSRLQSCVIVLTGDYHYADIKRLLPASAEQAAYTDHYGTKELTRPMWQVMASGMHESTSTHRNLSCEDQCCGYLPDDAGLRGPDRRCHAFVEPNFGVVDLDWTARQLRLRIMRGDSADTVAMGLDGSPMDVTIDMQTCEQV